MDQGEDDLEGKDELEKLKYRLREIEASLFLSRVSCKNLSAENERLKGLVGRRGKGRTRLAADSDVSWVCDLVCPHRLAGWLFDSAPSSRRTKSALKC
jgi:hypothetical protein